MLIEGGLKEIDDQLSGRNSRSRDELAGARLTREIVVRRAGGIAAGLPGATRVGEGAFRDRHAQPAGQVLAVPVYEEGLRLLDVRFRPGTTARGLSLMASALTSGFAQQVAGASGDAGSPQGTFSRDGRRTATRDCVRRVVSGVTGTALVSCPEPPWRRATARREHAQDAEKVGNHAARERALQPP
ncbi:hypothetical protein [Lentzea californiensis]|uniref:hypothetical protein n=1 Tax=Lentzea californiensis TaxID=438851 RepID=UPI00216541F1|nr:hypothetical protein [Lentzea californiensis]MCR3750605.1 hypothetical protein [Lentzea californiensis]